MSYIITWHKHLITTSAIFVLSPFPLCSKCCFVHYTPQKRYGKLFLGARKIQTVEFRDLRFSEYDIQHLHSIYCQAQWSALSVSCVNYGWVRSGRISKVALHATSMKTRFSKSVLKILKNHSRYICDTLRQFCVRRIFLTLSENEGHKGQKGQILKNVANCLKRMQNKNFLWNPSVNHVFNTFDILYFFHVGLS